MNCLWLGADIAKVVRLSRRRIVFYGLTLGRFGVGVIVYRKLTADLIEGSKP